MNPKPIKGITEKQAGKIWDALEFLQAILTRANVLNIIYDEKKKDEGDTDE